MDDSSTVTVAPSPPPAPAPAPGDGARSEAAEPPEPRVGLLDLAGELQTWLLLAPVLVVGVAGWNHRWVSDDGFINLRVVDLTVHGHPFSFNAGERVESGTSALWIAVLSALRLALGWFVDLPWLAVLGGLAFTVLGVSAAVAAAAALVRHVERPGAGGAAGYVLFPAGALVFTVLPPVWDFATSGLETGLTFAWIGGCQWLLTRHFLRIDQGDAYRGPSRRGRWLVPVVLGLGPLVRPDLAVFSVAFVAVYLALAPSGWRPSLRVIGAAVALPLVFELFRMAYFAALVPNTALAKEAGQANVAKGLAYLDNLINPYFLWIPLVIVFVWAASWLSTVPVDGDRRRRMLLLILAPVAAGIVHGAYIVHVGGDFMHGRLLLPAAAGILFPVAVLPVSRARLGPAVTVGTGVLVAWAVVCASELRLPEDAMAGRWADVEDERLGYIRLTGKRNPVSQYDYGALSEAPSAKARELAGKGDDALILATGDVVPLAPGSGVVLEADRLGAVSFAAGPEVTVHDLWGLSDAVSSRLTADPAGRIGHQKGGTTRAWELARRSVPAREVSALNARARNAALARGEQQPELLTLPVPEPDMVAAARVYLRCPAVRDLLDAVEQPLSPLRALKNVVAAPRFTTLRLPRDPRTASNCRGIG